MARNVLVLLVVTSSVARADRFVSGGVTAALGLHENNDAGLVLGGELSAGVFWEPPSQSDEHHDMDFRIDPYWLGGYADLVRDFGSDTTRLSIGPEFGKRMLGIDGGLLMQFGDQRRTGIAIRPVVTLSVVAVYLRYGHFFDDQPSPTHFELGLLVKLPRHF